MPTTIIIVQTTDANLIGDIVDLVTGRSASILAQVQTQTASVLKQAEAISTTPQEKK